MTGFLQKYYLLKEMWFMDEYKEDNNPVILEQVFNFICLVASYGVLFLLPQKIGILFYLIFGISAFLFCIGFFRLGLSFDAPADAKSAHFISLIYVVFGVLINTAGLYGIYKDHGSGRSIMIAILLLIEALLLYAIAANASSVPESQRITAIVLRIAAVAAILFGIAFIVQNHFSESSVMIGMILLLECICLWRMGSGSNPFNKLTPEVQSVPGMHTPIKQLHSVFAGVETQLGCPWIGKVQTIKQDSIIYGPSEDGFVVYAYYLFGRFYVAGSTNLLFPHPEKAQGHLVKELPDSTGTLLDKEYLPVAYANMFKRYAESGKAQWVADISNHSE